MPVFVLKVLRTGERVTRLRVEAPNLDQAGLVAAKQGYRVLSGQVLWQAGLFSFKKKQRFELIPFAQELLVLQQAGLSLREGLGALCANATNHQQVVLQNLLVSLAQGMSFSEALSRHPDDFPDLLCALVQASEKTSNLTEALANYIQYGLQADALRKKIVNALLYPALLLLVGGAVLLFLMMYVVPRFAGIYEGLQGDLPWLSQLLLAWGRLLRDSPGPVFLVLGGLAALFVRGLKSERVRHRVLSFVLRSPRIRVCWQAHRLGRLYRSLSLLIQGGIPVREALHHVVRLVSPLELARLNDVEHQIVQGIAFSSALQSNALVTPVSLQMLCVGERTGTLGQMLGKSADLLQAEVARTLEAFSRILEPVLMALIGLVIGVVVILMYMPIFELAGSLQ